MNAESQRPHEQEDTVPALDAAIAALNLAEKTSTITPAKAVFGSATALLATIRDSMVNRSDCVELGLSCAGVCQALDRGTKGKKPDELSQSVYNAITQLTLTVAEIQRKLEAWGQRNMFSRYLRAGQDKEAITTWKLNLDSILQTFNKLPENTNVADSPILHEVANTRATVSGVRNDVAGTPTVVSDSHRNTSKSPGNTRGQDGMGHASAPGDSPTMLPINTHGTSSGIRRDVVRARAIVSEFEDSVTSTHTMVSDIHRTMVKDQEGTGKNPLTRTSTLGESPPPAPRACFGRGELIDKIVGLAEDLTPTALIGPGGIGKTAIALAVLHHDRIIQRFGDSRRFVRCDQFPPTLAHFLRRLSEVIGADIENPEYMAPLRPFLSSQKMFIILDNAESILDPRGTNAQEIYDAVEELSQFKTICLSITSRITTVPRHCKRLTVPTLSMEAASDIFYGIYDGDGRSGVISDLLQRLDFHALSTTLLATTASHNMWDHDRLAREWNAHRTKILQTDYNESLAATIELSLASPTFVKLGPEARDLLGVVAFFPQGIDESNLDWFFPTVSERKNTFDKFCVLSLTHRGNGFITMLAPLRDYLSPTDPKISLLLCMTKDRYFTRLSVELDPNGPGFEEARWIVSEDVNVEHLLDVFTSIDANSPGIWDVCTCFMQHLCWHKARPVMLGQKIEALPDDHHSKPGCLFPLSLLFNSVGNHVECRRLLVCNLVLCRERGDDLQVAATLQMLANANRSLGLHDEGIQQAKEAIEIFERFGHPVEQAYCFVSLAQLLYSDEQFGAAEEATYRVIDLLPEKGDQFLVCNSHHLLGRIHQSKGERGKAIHHYGVALRTGAPFSWHNPLFWINHSLTELFLCEGEFDDAHTHAEQAKSHAVAANSAYNLGCVAEVQGLIWYQQHRFEEARSEFLHAIDIFERLGVVGNLGIIRTLLQYIQMVLDIQATSSQSDLNPLETQ